MKKVKICFGCDTEISAKEESFICSKCGKRFCSDCVNDCNLLNEMLCFNCELDEFMNL